MKRWRGHTNIAVVAAACVVAVAAVVAALVLTKDGDESSAPEPIAPTTGLWTPINIQPPKVPIIAGGIPVDIDPLIKRSDFSTTLFPLGTNRYRMTIFNTSTLGAIQSLQWFPPVGVRIRKVVGSDQGRCTLSGLTGFGGNQFPTVLLNPNIFCDKLDLKPPSCTCLGDGGAMTVTFVTNKGIAVGEGDLRVRTATLDFDRVPTYQDPLPRVRNIKRVVTSGGGDESSGGLTADERDAAQSALDRLQSSNISYQLVEISRWLQSSPATCRVRLVSRNPNTYRIYVFWTPWLAANPYVWLNMNVTDDPEKGTFRLGTTQPVLPGGRLKPNGGSVNRRTVDTTLLTRYGPDQARKSQRILAAQGGDVFAKPGAKCEVLKNGSLRLLPT